MKSEHLKLEHLMVLCSAMTIGSFPTMFGGYVDHKVLPSRPKTLQMDSYCSREESQRRSDAAQAKRDRRAAKMRKIHNQ